MSDRAGLGFRARAVDYAVKAGVPRQLAKPAVAAVLQAMWDLLLRDRVLILPKLFRIRITVGLTPNRAMFPNARLQQRGWVRLAQPLREAIRAVDPDPEAANARCRSMWHGRRCVDVEGHDGIHYAEDETDWIEGDATPGDATPGPGDPVPTPASDDG